MKKAKIELQKILNQKSLNDAIENITSNHSLKDETVDTLIKTFIDLKTLSKDREIWHK